MKNSIFLLFILFFLGCINDSKEEGYDFGFSYGMTITPETPSIKSDSLFVEVNYSGCDVNHSFILKDRISTNKAVLWLFKKTPDQPCDLYIQEKRSFKLKPEILAAKSIILVAPDESEIILK